MKLLCKKSLIVLATIIAFLACLLTGVGMLKANADAGEAVFDCNNAKSRIKLGGITAEDVENAFQTEGARLKEEMQGGGIRLLLGAVISPWAMGGSVGGVEPISFRRT